MVQSTGNRVQCWVILRGHFSTSDRYKEILLLITLCSTLNLEIIKSDLITSMFVYRQIIF